MGTVRVSISDAIERRLPLVSVRSGRAADGYLGVPIGLGFWARLGWAISRRGTNRPLAQLPLTQREFNRVIRLRRIELQGAISAPLFLVLGVAFARFPALAPLGLAIALVSIVTVITAHMTLQRILPEITRVGGSGDVRIEDPHESFASAVKSGDRRR